MKKVKTINPKVIRNEEIEDEMVNQIIEKSDVKDVKSAISIQPIIFSKELNCNLKTSSILDAPLNIFRFMNFEYGGDNNTYLENLNDNSLYNITMDNKYLAAKLATDYIIQNSFINICNMIDNSEFTKLGYSDYFNIKQFVNDELLKFRDWIYDIINACIYPANKLITCEKKEFDKNTKSLIDFLTIKSSQISICIYNALCIGIDKAINDIVFQVHVIPNINLLYDKLKSDYGFGSKMHNIINEYNFSTCASIYLKTLFAEDMKWLVKVIQEITENTLIEGLVGGAYWYFEDEIEYRKRQKDPTTYDDILNF